MHVHVCFHAELVAIALIGYRLDNDGCDGNGALARPSQEFLKLVHAGRKGHELKPLDPDADTDGDGKGKSKRR